MEEKIFYDENPAMFRNRPLLFILSLAAIIFYGAGLVILIYWYFKTKATRFIITNNRVEVKRGLLSKNTSEIRMADIRNVQTNQSLFQRIFGVGEIIISSAATGGVEIQVNGMKNPKKVKEILRKNQGNY